MRQELSFCDEVSELRTCLSLVLFSHIHVCQLYVCHTQSLHVSDDVSSLAAVSQSLYQSLGCLYTVLKLASHSSS